MMAKYAMFMEHYITALLSGWPSLFLNIYDLLSGYKKRI